MSGPQNVNILSRSSPAAKPTGVPLAPEDEVLVLVVVVVAAFVVVVVVLAVVVVAPVVFKH